MRRELILLRHAHADMAFMGQPDDERPLSLRGRSEAIDAAGWFATHPLPDRIVCSPARRARETLIRALPDPPAEPFYDERIYEASPGELIALVDEHAAAGRLLLIGHNPGLEELVALLSDGQSSHYRGMPPAAIAWLTWLGSPLPEPGTVRLLEFWSP